jgi:RNA polymerase sigma-70 factor (ECF subfamily)
MASELDALTDSVRAPWRRFRDLFEPLRPELYRYCRHLTHNAWDAEDLVQDTMTRAFVTLPTMFGDVPHPRAWLFRVASNLWIDRARRARHEPLLEASEPALDSAVSANVDREARGLREAAGTLLVQLSPQERAALVLKDAFQFSLEEIADALGTTLTAIKAALHRGRGKLPPRGSATEQNPEEPTANTHGTAAVDARAPNREVLDAFCRSFNARDLGGLLALLLSSATVEIVGVVTEYGTDAPADPKTGSFVGMLSPITFDERGGVAPELLGDYAGSPARAELRSYHGAPVLLCWYDHASGPAVRCVMTFEFDGQKIAHVRNYFFSPDLIAEICSELGVPYRANGYRYW